MKDEQIIALAVKHHVDGCLSHNLKLISFAKAIADIQKEKDAQICEIEQSKFKEYDFAASACRGAIGLCIDAIRSPESDIDQATRLNG